MQGTTWLLILAFLLQGCAATRYVLYSKDGVKGSEIRGRSGKVDNTKVKSTHRVGNREFVIADNLSDTEIGKNL
jgi:hypothetical protein